MQIVSLDIPDVKIVTPVKHGDERGFFSEIFSKPILHEAGIALDLIQENFALSAQRNTVRGLHFQTPPFAQDKLIQVLRGAIYDVAVDLRRNSPWYGQFVSAEISADSWNQILVPAGFAHGMCTLEPDTQVLYRVTAPYAPDCDGGIRWDDPDIAIPWPTSAAEAVLSERDAQLPLLADFDTPFIYGDAA